MFETDHNYMVWSTYLKKPRIPAPGLSPAKVALKTKIKEGSQRAQLRIFPRTGATISRYR